MSQEIPDKVAASEPLDTSQPGHETGHEDAWESAAELDTGAVAGKDSDSRAPRNGAQGKSGRGMALLALAGALAALAWTTWTWQDAQRNLASLSALDQTGTSQRDNLQQSMAELRREVARLEAGRAALEGARQDTFNDVAGLSQRLANLESMAKEERGVSNEVRNKWILAEVEYFLQIANARLQLARDVKSAVSALRLADGRLSTMEDPALTEVRRKIRGELMDLDAVKLPDIQGIALTLGTLATRIDQLPLSRAMQLNSEQPVESVDENGDGWDRAVSKMGQAFSGIISVRKTDELATPLLSPSEEYFLRRNLELKLEAARLALLYGDEASYRESLRNARRWLNEYFDTSDTATGKAIETLGQLEVQSIRPVLPDISGSLGLLKILTSNSGM
ncbi:MAG: uroporphyrinogen-III C-methyltransferase [Gammaproteobacteria bacterium]|nr:uroporphyrinogen-III C-methyltransferase [Gammaproteobacteria bacterium]